MEKKTALNPLHRHRGARMVSFGGWEMPLHYGSQLEEHLAVRQQAGIFDVSHMLIIDLHGNDVRNFLARVLANDVGKLQTPGQALYSCMLREDGGVIDDLIVYYCAEQWFRMVVNAATADKDSAWLHRNAMYFDVKLRPRDDLGMIALQGPNAQTDLPIGLPAALAQQAALLKPFHALVEDQWLVARTGYTGEDGFEMMLPESVISDVWQKFLSSEISPCGLGARDSLRLEAGLNLYGMDMDETVTPLESGLGWTIAFEPTERDFIGRSALLAQRESGALRRFTGVLLEGRGVLRAHQPLFQDARRVGELTSGGFSPTLQRSIGLARVDSDSDTGLTVEIRGKRQPVRLHPPPFVRRGRSRLNP